MQIKTEKKVLYFETLLPLINIVFLLLIFFLLAGSFNSPEPFLVNSPYANAVTDEEKEVAIFFLNAEGQFAYKDRLISQQELLDYAAKLAPINGKNIIRLKADSEAAADAVIVLLEALAEVGITEVRIVTLVNDA